MQSFKPLDFVGILGVVQNPDTTARKMSIRKICSYELVFLFVTWEQNKMSFSSSENRVLQSYVLKYGYLGLISFSKLVQSIFDRLVGFYENGFFEPEWAMN